jgi:hypothetical protein
MIASAFICGRPQGGSETYCWRGFIMTVFRFGYAATAPGQETGQAWDAHWIGLSDWQSYDAPADGINQTTRIYDIYFHVEELITGEPLSLVTAAYSGPTQSSEEDFTLNYIWDSVKDIELTELDTTTLNVTGFVDTWIAAAGDNTSHNVTVTSAKRGAIDLGNGNNSISVNYLSNEYTWSNHFHIGVGNGNNTINVQPDVFSDYASDIPQPSGVPNTPVPVGWVFNTAPDLTTVGITLGSGDNTVALQECSGTITAGSGTTNVSLVDGHNALVLGSGTATVTIAAHNTAEPVDFSLATDRGSDIVQLGSGHADISIDDTMASMTPLTFIIVTHGDTGTGTADGPDDIRYGHTSGGTFVGGDWSALTLDLVGYSAGSSASLSAASDHTVLTIQDAAGGAADVLNLYGASPSSIAALHLQFA